MSANLSFSFNGDFYFQVQFQRAMPKAIVKLDGEIIFFQKKMIEHLIVILIVFNLMVILRSILNGG